MATFGAFQFPTLPRTRVHAGIASELGTLIGNGEVVAYVRSGGVANGMNESVKQRLHTTLNGALAQVRSGTGDTVVVMHDHAENIASADQMSNLVAGTKIVGLGHGTLRPTFTWTTATSTFLFDVANVEIHNCILTMCTTANAGVTVAAPITVSAAGCGIYNCHLDVGADADDIVGQAINTTAAADDLTIAYNTMIGATAAEAETIINVIGCDRLRLIGNYISAATSAVAVGVVRCETTASTDVLIYGNYFANNKASSQEALTLMAGVTGFMDHNHLAVLDNASVAMDAVGNITMGASNTLANTVGERGLVLGTVSA